jgi:predicted acyl esterase
MMGISWGGFNGLQIAARHPPALKAIVTICSSDVGTLRMRTTWAARFLPKLGLSGPFSFSA